MNPTCDSSLSQSYKAYTFQSQIDFFCIWGHFHFLDQNIVCDREHSKKPAIKLMATDVHTPVHIFAL